jgi:GDP-mannose 6-dehydrogenase
LQCKRTFHLIVVCQSTTSSDIQNFISHYLEKSTGKSLGKDFGLCFLSLSLRQEQALEDFYALKNAQIVVSDKTSTDIVKKLFDGFNTKIKYQRYEKTID